ncbi:MAG: DUF1127 domain-containing protein [Gammaproteobacteria bacterium]|nr:DUF1127 domain-containing protein [Gammaproteobacteria bacterium]
MSTLKAKHFHLIEDLDISALTFAAVERVEGFAVNVNNQIRLWLRRSNERNLLSQMNDHILDDIGLTRADVKIETAKYFWQH